VGIWFEPFQADRCCLCGSADKLTGEHKIKASALRSVFHRAAMVIGKFDGQSQPRNAQGPKSRAFHFEARMCVDCNGTQTQEADREFDRFHASVDTLVCEARAPGDVFDNPRYLKGSDAYLNIFRYFAKLLSCHVAESGGPRAIQVTRFARGVLNNNPIFLAIDLDPTYADFTRLSGELAYAAHGGLIVPMDRHSKLPTSFRSSLTIGPVRYLYWVKFDVMVGMALTCAHKAFYEKCLAAFEKALRNPMSEDERRRLGI
jgi:hypothetical protein